MHCKRGHVPCTVARVTADFGKGFTTTNPMYMRSFYLAFPIHHALHGESAAAEKVNASRSESPRPWMRAAVRLESGAVPVAPTLGLKISWTHDRLLIDARHVDEEQR